MQYPFGYIPDEDKTGIKRWNLIHDEMMPILGLYKQSDITDIFVDRYDKINVMRRGVLEKTDCAFNSEEALVSLIEQLRKTLNQDFGLNAPILDARLPDGSRLNCTHVSVTPQGSSMSLRKVPVIALSKSNFIDSGMLTEEMLAYLVEMIEQKDIFLISGNMGSGKTSLLRFLSEYIDKRERLITAEDTQELHINERFPFGLAMEAAKRKDSPIDLPALIHATLRQQPDRVWVGEFRVAEAVDAFMQIIYTGVRGCAGTIHGSSCLNAIIRMQYLLASSGKVDYHLTGELIRGAINVIIQTHRDPKWGRRVTEIGRLVDGEVKLIFKFNTKTGEHERVDVN
ncbi:TPA: CpaF family protein [Klebsiella pneumoniae]|uniref:CpaF family protein n=1 Tax=Salmonella enterica TaxID=28901 RepID=A0A5Y7V009_SALER|nr:ATPase, T2SS/T4P/T4SS family [Klebsiella pneumoniae]EAQ9840291.1 CpaF family protein [Salmonella enterica]EBW3677312.1 CpaF family protein [Salmonella enterica subsp. enterica serovar Hadar]ECC9367449.1 CpaF family protein [Salmonella enterica subsp. salamae]ECM7525667.1 CpaF family protein [Salmonella enterica subsp. enterica serovar Montevideo]ECN4550478.1 CpaF family protein [Salmonella enterica subsp. enterica serovar Typhimurium]ECQ0950102.1 CpaF family protein [Salmonella enterica su